MIAEEDLQAAAERRTALRALLMEPLLTSEKSSDELLLVRRHRDHLTRLCSEGLGYRLVVEPSAARLYKAGLGRDATRPLRKPVNRGTGRRFEPRAYAVLCLALAALTRCPGQLLLDELEQPGRVERLVRQRAQVRQFGVERGSDGDRPPGDHPGVIDQVAGGDELVELGQRGEVRDRYQMAAAEPADLTFHPTFLVRAFLAGDAEENRRTRNDFAAR